MAGGGLIAVRRGGSNGGLARRHAGDDTVCVDRGDCLIRAAPSHRLVVCVSRRYGGCKRPGLAHLHGSRCGRDCHAGDGDTPLRLDDRDRTTAALGVVHRGLGGDGGRARRHAGDKAISIHRGNRRLRGTPGHGGVVRLCRRNCGGRLCGRAYLNGGIFHRHAHTCHGRALQKAQGVEVHDVGPIPRLKHQIHIAVAGGGAGQGDCLGHIVLPVASGSVDAGELRDGRTLRFVKIHQYAGVLHITVLSRVGQLHLGVGCSLGKPDALIHGLGIILNTTQIGDRAGDSTGGAFGALPLHAGGNLVGGHGHDFRARQLHRHQGADCLLEQGESGADLVLGDVRLIGRRLGGLQRRLERCPGGLSIIRLLMGFLDLRDLRLQAVRVHLVIAQQLQLRHLDFFGIGEGKLILAVAALLHRSNGKGTGVLVAVCAGLNVPRKGFFAPRVQFSPGRAVVGALQLPAGGGGGGVAAGDGVHFHLHRRLERIGHGLFPGRAGGDLIVVQQRRVCAGTDSGVVGQIHQGAGTAVARGDGGRLIVGFHAPAFGGLAAHGEGDGGALAFRQNIGVHIGLGLRLAVDADALDVLVLPADVICGDGDGSIIVPVDDRLFKQRRTQGGDAVAVGQGVETQGGEDVPGAGLRVVLVAEVALTDLLAHIEAV